MGFKLGCVSVLCLALAVHAFSPSRMRYELTRGKLRSNPIGIFRGYDRPVARTGAHVNEVQDFLYGVNNLYTIFKELRHARSMLFHNGAMDGGYVEEVEEEYPAGGYSMDEEEEIDYPEEVQQIQVEEPPKEPEYELVSDENGETEQEEAKQVVLSQPPSMKVLSSPESKVEAECNRIYDKSQDLMCPAREGFFQVGDSCYYLSTLVSTDERMNLQQAASTCATIGIAEEEGTQGRWHLATVNSGLERKWIQYASRWCFLLRAFLLMFFSFRHYRKRGEFRTFPVLG